ncbi:MAG: response regulator [Deltaproteobacteria bacterium]|nr:response regulator [Deltaproteobacteria bacterium]
MGRVFEISLADDCEVTVVTTGAEALPMAQHLSPDLVVADLSLADLDGYAICAELRKDDALAQVPVLLCHGSNTTYDAARAQQVGATDVIEKPFATQDLVDKVHELTAA